jgi:UDP:flavonoid glycosyltransferase YjiC (YdhE family)
MIEGSANRRRVLLVAEAVTLAHFARCVALAGALDPKVYDIHLASDPRYLSLVPHPLPFTFHNIRSIPSAQFTHALAQGRPVYDAQTLAAYVETDLALLDKLKPDLVVGDFRLSLAVSAPVARVPYASIINAYWSPYALIRYPVPDLPFVRLLGVGAGQRLFDLIRPLAFALHALPLNVVRRRHGLPSLGHDLRQVYSWADHTVYPDIPEAVTMAQLPSNHHFIGPVLWSAQSAAPEWWNDLPQDKPNVYVTLGSSGNGALLPVVLEALAGMPVNVLASAAGNVAALAPPANAYVADFLPGEQATARAALVICNGGSLTTYQALVAGTPVIGVATNMDQLLNMQIAERFGAGCTVRAAQATQRNIRERADAVLHDQRMANAARVCASLIDAGQSAVKFTSVVAGIC